MQRRIVTGLAAGIVVLAACSNEPQLSGPTEQTVAPLLAVGQQSAPDRYIVIFKSNVADVSGETDRVTRGSGSRVLFTYDRAIKGFAASIPAAALEGIRRNPNVSYVEADGIATVNVDQAGPPSWGIDRVDERDLPLDNIYHYDYTGSNVHAYIVDTGIWPDHEQYKGRVTSGYDFIDNDNDTMDCHGHGTHVSGTVGGTTTGIAKQVQLVGVRVLNCQGSGSWSQVIAGINWVANNAIKPAVANMSLGGGFSQSVNDAVTGAVAAGVTFAIAAGNSNADACSFSPASAPNAVTVGATTSTDARSSFSNYGSCVDIFAPGSGIVSSVMSGGYESWSGTSMATPHVAGAAALLLSANPTWTPAQVASALISNSTKGVVTDTVGSPNRLLYTLTGGGSPPANNPPTASFTYSCTYLACTFNGTGADGDGTVVGYSWSFGDGTGSTIEDPSKTYSSAGTRTVTLTVTDDDGATTIASQSVTVSAPPPSGTVSVSALGSSSSWKNGSRKQWNANVTITVRNNANALVSGAVVTGSWSAGASGSTSCTTNASGQCTVSKLNVASGTAGVTWSVGSISSSGLSYSSAGNAASSTVVNRPL